MGQMGIEMGQHFIRLIVVLTVALVSSAAMAQLSADAKFAKSVKDGNLRDIQIWVVNGGNVNARDPQGVPAIVIAAQNNLSSVLKYLVDNGANTDAESRETGETALMLAAESGDSRVVLLLARNGADLDLTDKKGETALMKAARSGKRAAAKALIESGAATDLEDYTGRTALQIARDQRSRGVVEALTSAGVEY